MSESQLVSFYLGEALFGMNILMVREIIRHPAVTPVDQAPENVVGLLNLRGQIFTILDYSLRLGLRPRRLSPSSHCLILKTEAEIPMSYYDAHRLDEETSSDQIGVLADRIGDVITVNDSEIKPPPPNLGGINSRYVSGVVPLKKELMAVLKTGLLLSVHETLEREPQPQS